MSNSRQHPIRTLALTLLLLLAAPLLAKPLVGEPDHTSGQYRESVTDIYVKVLGGFINWERAWYEGRWHFNPRWAPLRLRINAASRELDSITRSKSLYEPVANNPRLFKFGKRNTIEQTDTGFRWRDREGNWIDYNAGGQMTRYGDRNDVQVSVTRDERGRIIGIFDHHGEQMLWLQYEAENEGPSEVHDYTNRRVRYLWDGANLLKSVIDLRGNEWKYTYGGSGSRPIASGAAALASTASAPAPAKVFDPDDPLPILLATKTDPEGRTITLTYDGGFRLIKVEDPLGVWRQYLYDYDKTRKEFLYREIDSVGKQTDSWFGSDGALVRQEINGQTVQTKVRDGNDQTSRDGNGLETKYEYDDWDNNTKIIYADGSSVSYEYATDFSTVAKFTNENRVATVYTYDSLGNRIRATEAVGTSAQRTTEYTYDRFGNPLTMLRQADIATIEALRTYAYDRNGNVTAAVDPEGFTTRYDYDVLGNIIGKKTPSGDEWRYDFDKAAMPILETDPLGNKTSYGYDKTGRRILVTDSSDHHTSYSYDARNNVIAFTDAMGNLWTFEYDGEGNATAALDPTGLRDTYQYDAVGRLIAYYASSGNHLTYQYSNPGGGVGIFSPAKLSHPRYSEAYVYDQRGREIRSIRTLRSGETQARVSAFDLAGNEISSTDHAGRITMAAYDSLNRLVSTTNAEDYSTYFKYDSRDNLISVENAFRVLRSFEYDRNDRLIAERMSTGELRTFSYDASGRVYEKVDGKGQKTKYQYDSAGRLLTTRILAADGASPQQEEFLFRYDSVGNLIGYDGSFTNAIYSYDANRRKTQETIDFGGFQTGFSYVYGANGRKVALIYPDGMQTSFFYDRAGNLSRIEIPSLGSIGLDSYNETNPGRVLYPGGLERTLVYDDIRRITEIVARDSLQRPILDYSIRYDEANNVLSKVTEHGTYTFEYDALDRLAIARGPNMYESYSYDPIGNRQVVGDGHQWHYDESDRLINDDFNRYSYDKNGSIAAIENDKGVHRLFEYHLSNRLKKVEDGEHREIAYYEYDPFGRRVYSRNRNGESYYIFADEGLIGEVDQSGAWLRRYGWKPGAPWGTAALWSQDIKKGEFSFFLTDHLGTPWMIVLPNGSVLWEGRYSAFGQFSLIKGDPKSNLFRFPGHYDLPEIGASYNYFRTYNPLIGRYLESDPIGLAGGINAYAYSGNNPSTYSDPTGLETYQCKQPLHALGGKGEASGPDISLNPLYHQYSCIVRTISICSKKIPIKICGGQDRSGDAFPSGSPGIPSSNCFKPDRCKVQQEDNWCFELCVLDKWARPRPWYAVGFAGTDCQEYDEDVHKRCRIQCRL